MHVQPGSQLDIDAYIHFEPSAWNWEGTNGDVTGTGVLQLIHHTTGPRSVYIDDLDVHATAAAVYLADDFTGTNGAGWNTARWVTTTNDSTRAVDILGNEGRLYLNGATPPGATAQMTPVADSEATLTYRFSDRNPQSYLRVALRASGATGADAMPNAYRVTVRSDSDTIYVEKYVNSVSTNLGSFTYPRDANPHRLRFRVEGTTLKLKVWPASGAEPSAWNWEGTNGDITGAGVLQLIHHTTGPRSVFIDDLDVHATTAAVTATTSTYVPGPGGLLLIDHAGTPTYPLANGHGDIVGTTDAAGTYTAVPVTDEFGKGQTPDNRLGWLGTQQRYTTHPATGIIRMGARLYDPNLGAFLQADPIEGGCANDYTYVHGDPVNSSDLSGEGSCNDVGVMRNYATGLTLSVLYRGQSRDQGWVRYEIILRVNYSYRPNVNRAALVVESGNRFYGYDRRGRAKYHHERHIYQRPDPAAGKMNPYYVHTTWTVRAGSELEFAGAAANGPQLMTAGPWMSCRAEFK